MNTELLNLPWKKVATDLFYWKASTCLLLVDYYSRYIEISKVNRESSGIISHKINLCQAWVLREVVSDNRPHIHPMNTSNLQPNMILPTQQAVDAIFEITGKQKEP